MDPAPVVVGLVSRIVPSIPNPLPGRGVEGVGIRGMHHQVIDGGFLVDVEDLLPALATVGGLVEAPVLIVGPLMARGGYINGVGVGGVDDDPSDGVRAG